MLRLKDRSTRNSNNIMVDKFHDELYIEIESTYYNTISTVCLTKEQVEELVKFLNTEILGKDG